MSTDTPISQRRRYTAAEACELLACSKSTLHELCQKHSIGSFFGRMRVLTGRDVETVRSHLKRTNPVEL